MEISVVRLFGQTSTGQNVVVIDKQYRPSFFVETETGKEWFVLRGLKSLRSVSLDKVFYVSDVKEIDKKKYLVPMDLTIGQFVFDNGKDAFFDQIYLSFESRRIDADNGELIVFGTSLQECLFSASSIIY